MSTIVTPDAKRAEVAGVVVIVYVRELGSSKAVQHVVPLDVPKSKSLLHFIQHRLQGGRLTLTKIERQQQQIITPP
jgi:hypothetical protein